MKIHVCKYCGCANIYQDAYYRVNADDYSTYDDMVCGGCSAEGSNITVEVEVDDDFDIDSDIFDLEKLE